MTEIVAKDPMLALAELMLNADYTRGKLDQESIASARREQMEALDDETHSLHEAADHVRVGGWVEGGLTIAGAGLVMTAHLEAPAGEPLSGKLEALRASGQVLEALSDPLGKEFGDAPSADANADAKQAEKAGVDAGTRADQASRHYERVQDAEDRTLGALESTLSSESQGRLAIIANV